MDERRRVIAEETKVMRDFVGFLEKAVAVTEERKREIDHDVSLMLKQYNDDNMELYSQIIMSTDMQELMGQTLKSCKKALQAPFFARIDFHEDGTPKKMPLYIGKAGVNDQETNETLIVDWRAPVANLYYEGDLGRASYTCLDGTIEGELSLKRTFTVEDREIVDYYDSDVVTNDALLQEYLAKNSDVVLKDIVATIQKDQNEIIRVDPWVNVLVQGVAGSGKTTVAMHRISYILYNFPQYKPKEFVIIGANHMFLNYVAGMLPELGVEAITQMVLPDFLLTNLGVLKQKKPPVFSPYLTGDTDGVQMVGLKSSMSFFSAMERFLDRFTEEVFESGDVSFYGHSIMTADEFQTYGVEGISRTVWEKYETLRAMMERRVKNILPGLVNMEEIEQLGFELDENANIQNQRKKLVAKVKAQAREVKKVFDKRIKALDEKKLYERFLTEWKQQDGLAGMLAETTLKHLKKGELDLYDLCALLYIKARLFPLDEIKAYKHIMIDEAQDFGVMVYACLSSVFAASSFTIMGDVSQNITVGTGISDWDEVRNALMQTRPFDFRVLSKSYRNTIEIAEVANRVLQKLALCPGGPRKVYDIAPVVRHGSAVEFLEGLSGEDMLQRVLAYLDDFQQAKYKTTAIICKTAAQCEELYNRLSPLVSVHYVRDAEDDYEGGVTIFPILHVKGMEFDTVILYGAGQGEYSLNEHDVKLLYVALTRGLHELRVLCEGEKSELFH